MVSSPAILACRAGKTIFCDHVQATKLSHGTSYSDSSNSVVVSGGYASAGANLLILLLPLLVANLQAPPSSTVKTYKSQQKRVTTCKHLHKGIVWTPVLFYFFGGCQSGTDSAGSSNQLTGDVELRNPRL